MKKPHRAVEALFVRKILQKNRDRFSRRGLMILFTHKRRISHGLGQPGIQPEVRVDGRPCIE